jgi:hypothetical protein
MTFSDLIEKLSISINLFLMSDKTLGMRSKVPSLV